MRGTVNVCIGSGSRVAAVPPVADEGGVRVGCVLPCVVPGVDEVERAVGQPLMQKLGVGRWHRGVSRAGDDLYRRLYLREQIAQERNVGRVAAQVAHRLDEAVAVVGGEVVLAVVVGPRWGMLAGMERVALERWNERYERLWRTAGTDGLSELFTADATYLPSPWSQPISGLDALAVFWEEERDGPDEQFTLTWEVVAVEGDVGVTRVEVTYDRGAMWRNLWIVRLNADGRCTAFEEWPFAPTQPDGHE
jgi:hypothetical protein